MKYFLKHLVFNPVNWQGRPVSWEALAGEEGVRQIDEQAEPELVARLQECARSQIHGIEEISLAQYELKKKTLPEWSSVAKPPELLRAWAQPGPKAPANAAAASPPASPPASAFFNEGSHPMGRQAYGLPEPIRQPPTPPIVPNGVIVRPGGPTASPEPPLPSAEPAQPVKAALRAKIKTGRPRPRGAVSAGEAGEPVLAS